MPNPTISIVTTVYDAKDYIPIGMELEIDGRKFVIDSVNFGAAAGGGWQPQRLRRAV